MKEMTFSCVTTLILGLLILNAQAQVVGVYTSEESTTFFSQFSVGSNSVKDSYEVWSTGGVYVPPTVNSTKNLVYFAASVENVIVEYDYDTKKVVQTQKAPEDAQVFCLQLQEDGKVMIVSLTEAYDVLFYTWDPVTKDIKGDTVGNLGGSASLVTFDAAAGIFYIIQPNRVYASSFTLEATSLLPGFTLPSGLLVSSARVFNGKVYAIGSNGHTVAFLLDVQSSQILSETELESAPYGQMEVGLDHSTGVLYYTGIDPTTQQPGLFDFDFTTQSSTGTSISLDGDDHYPYMITYVSEN